MWRLFYVCSLLLVIITEMPAHAAEATTGAIVGLVLANGAPVANAHVNASSPSGSYTASTNVRGHFTILGVTPDSYAVSVLAPGFAPASASGVVVMPNQTQQVTFHLVAQLKTIANARARVRAFISGNTGDVFTVSVRGVSAPPVSASGLANYSAGTVQGVIAAVPGVAFDPFANAILRGGKVDDAVFDFDSVPVPQGLIAEPGGNVVGAQLPATGIATTTVTLAGYETQGDNALGGVIDEIPAVGTYPGSTTLDVSDGLAGAKSQIANLQVLGATPDQRWRYAVAATAGGESFAYGNGHTFYPAEAATYGLGLESRSQYALESNVHFRMTSRDDLSLLGFAGNASYNEYGTPYAGQTFGAFDGAALKYPGETNPNASVTFPAGIRGSFGIFKAAWLHTGSHTLSRVQVYESQFGASAGGPYWDENGFPNGTFSFFGRQSGREQAIVFDGDNFLNDRHHLRYGLEYRLTHYSLDQVVPTFDEIVRSNPILHSYLAYAGDTWHAAGRLDLMGALRLTGTRIAPSTGRPYGVGALDPHFSAVYRIGPAYALRATFDHTTVAPKPLEADRYDSTNVDPNGNPAPFVTLVPETANVYTASLEGSGKTELRFTYWAELESNRIDVLPFNYRQPGGELAPSPVGVPANVGQLRAHGVELWISRAGLTFNGEYMRASSSSASEFAYNNLNAPAIAAGHLFPVGYVPDLTATLSYELQADGRRIRIEPSISYESGYPYGVGRMAWVFDPSTKRPIQVPNDNHVNPGSSYYFLQDPSLPYDARSNPYIGTMGTPEGSDPNTLRSPPQTLVNLRIEGDLTPRLTAIVDVANLLGTCAPTAYGANGYLIGPPGYAGGNPLYAAYYQGVMGSPQPYLLGNGVPTNDGVTQSVPWTYGRSGYVPYSYPMARSVQFRLRWRL
ncbi:MAG TPA: TonB-dependent receptor [Candidatus Baltobacteraceae bacterium]|nr:TonB-dependent receptor [Candidatus Baltobacteraceae bacterium]